MKVMFDTNIFNRILDGKFDFKLLPKSVEIFATHIQRDEILNTPDNYKDRRSQLLKLFKHIVQERTPTESFVLGISSLNNAKLGSGSLIPTESGVWDFGNFDEIQWTPDDNLYDPILIQLKKLDSNKSKTKSHMRDALIAETALKNHLKLVTSDKNLEKVFKKFSDLILLIN